MINTGLGNFVPKNKIIAVVSPESAPVKRLVAKAKDTGMIIDVTYGRSTKSVIIMESNHVVLSPTIPDTIMERFCNSKLVTKQKED